jgi:hypothetical protein
MALVHRVTTYAHVHLHRSGTSFSALLALILMRADASPQIFDGHGAAILS